MAARLFVEIGAKIGDFQKAMGQIERKVNRFSRKMERMGTNLTQAVSLPLAGLGTAAVAAAAKFETLQTSFEVLLGDAERGAALFKDLQEFAARTPFALEQVATGAKQLIAFGLSADQAKAALGFLGDIAGATGSNLQDLTLIFGQARSIGAAYTQDLRQLAQRGIPVFDLLAEKTGLSGEALKKFIEDGKVSFELLTELLQSTAQEGGKFFGGMEKQSKTLSGVFSTFKDNVALAMGEIGNAIVDAVDLTAVMEKLTKAIQRAAGWFKDLSPEAKRTGLIIAAVAAATGPLLIILGKLASIIPLLTTGVSALAGAFAFLFSWPGVITAAVVGLIVVFVKLFNKFEAFRVGTFAVIEVLKELGKTISIVAKAVVQSLGFNFKGAFKTIKEGFSTLGTDLYSAIAVGISKGGKKISLDGLKKELKNELDSLSESIAPTVSPTAPVDFGGGAGGGASSGDETKSRGFVGFQKGIADIEKLNERVIQSREETLKWGTSLALVSEGFGRTTQMIEPLPPAIDAMTEAAHRFAGVMSGTFGGAMEAAGQAMQDVANQGETSFKKLGQAALKAAAQVVRAKLIEAVSSYLASAFARGGIFGFALAAAGGALVGTLFNSVIKGLKIPALAQGGLAFGPSLAVVGDNPGASANPEVIAPLDKLRNMMGSNVNVTGEFRIRGTDLVLTLEKAEKEMNRIR